jgi:hypothetical protein
MKNEISQILLMNNDDLSELVATHVMKPSDSRVISCQPYQFIDGALSL